jgi:hypothetical protein
VKRRPDQLPEAQPVARVDRLWMVDPGTIRGIVHGPLPNKSNSKQIVMIPRKSEKADLVHLPYSQEYMEAILTLADNLRGRLLQFYERWCRAFMDLQGKRPLVIKSPEARKYEQQFQDTCEACASELGRLPDGAKFYFRAVVFQQNLVRDLDCELLPDLLQKNNLIGNDRAIWRKEYERKIDKENPRVEFEIGVWQDPEVRSLFDKI